MATTYRAQVVAGWAGTATTTVTVPATVASTDWGLLVVNSAANNTVAITAPTGWTTLVAQTNYGSGSYAVYARTGLAASATFGITKGDALTPVVASAVWYAGGTGFGAVGTTTARTTTTTTTTAVPHGTATAYTFSVAVAIGKTSTAMTVNAGSTRSQVYYGASSGHPYAQIVDSTGTPATKTFTSNVAGASGLGFQIAVLDTVTNVDYSNNFEAVGSGAAVTTANSGGTGNTPVHGIVGSMVAQTTAALNGSRGVLSQLAASTESSVFWNVTGSVHYARRYFKFDTLPVNHNMRLMWGALAGTPVWEARLLFDGNYIDVTVDGTQRMFLPTGSDVPSGGIVPANLYRLEVLADSASGTAEARLYLGHSNVLVSSDTYSGTIGAIDTVRYGNRNGTTVTSVNRVDDIAYSNHQWPGPAPFTNTAPIVNAGADFIAEPFTTATLVATGTDDSGPITFAWTKVSGPTVTLNGTGAVRTFSVPPSLTDQTFVFRITGTDSGGLSSSDTVTVSVPAVTQTIAVGGVWEIAQFVVHTSEF